MLKSDLPYLTPAQYGGANELRTAVWKALEYASMYPNSAGAIETFLSEVGVLATSVKPVNTVAPAITGTAQVGQTLTASNGTWTGTPAPTYTKQWYADGVAIAGATAGTYVPVAGDVGKVITAAVAAKNVAGTVTVVTAGTAAVIA